MFRILLIEDDQPLRRALRIFLEKSGYAVSEAGNGREGLRIFGVQPVDLVVTDLIMPEMEGLETIRALRKTKQAVPIVAISGGGRIDSRSYLEYARSLGADCVLDKPLDFNEMAGRIAGLLGTRKEAGVTAHPQGAVSPGPGPAS
jgi:DNA-binding response OmpR family regulator